MAERGTTNNPAERMNVGRRDIAYAHRSQLARFGRTKRRDKTPPAEAHTYTNDISYLPET